ncbi:MAG: lysylphosphatidylglycerol synthase domain-containing protein [bacterium]|jgi:hypothetical protein|nr:lysylphosphatidylglycerol synthase domain-containing protein [bacterium]
MIKKVLSLLGKIVLSAILLGYLLSKIEIGELYLFFRSLPLQTIGIVLLLGFVNIGLQGLRFLYTCHQILPPFSLKQGIIAHLSGFLFRLVLPASIGEVGKAFLLPGTNKQRIYAFLLDAFFSVGTLFFFFGIATYMLYPAMWYMLGFCLIFVLLFLIYRLLRKNSNFRKYVPEEVPYLKIGVMNILFSTLGFSAYIFQFWVVLYPYGIRLLDQAKVCFFILGVGSIPLSFAGIGFSENAANHALKAFSVPSEAAVGTALFIFFVNVILPALAGVILLNFFSEVGYRHIRELVKKMISKEKK